MYYLKCRSAHAFLKIGERQLFIWKLMDGDHTIRDIMYAYREEYKAMPIFQITQAVNIFKGCRMLDEPDETVFDRLGHIFEDGAKKLHLNPLYLLTKAKITIDNIDPKVEKLYRWGGWLIFKPYIWIPLFLISFTGVGLALYTLFSGQVLAEEIGNLGGGMYALFTYLTLMPLIFIHEMLHALTVKHYKREVMGGGFMLLRGMPAMFMDTSDMWMDRNKWHRIKVSVAGPLANICLAGILSLIALEMPVSIYSAFLFALAINNIANAVLNMCPLIELDGYFALMDLVDESGLRSKALKFIRKDFPKRWKQMGKFSRKEWLFLVFGLLALLYTFAITSCMVMFAIRIVVINPVLGVIIGIIAILYLSYRLWYKVKAARKWRKQNEKSEALMAKAKPTAALNSPAVLVTTKVAATATTAEAN
jgi:putative peptide zinc metalloprotease protein